MSQTKNMISDRAVKLAGLAMDNGTTQGERRNAAEMFFREISRTGIRPRDLQVGEKIIYQEKVVYKEKEKHEQTEYCMPFGKYRGRRIVDILNFDREYLEWAYWNANALEQHEGVSDYIADLLGV